MGPELAHVVGAAVFVLAMAEQPVPVPAPIDDPRVSVALAEILLACLAGDPGRRPRARALLAVLA